MKTFVKYLFIAFFLLFSSNGFAQKSLTDFDKVAKSRLVERNSVFE